MRHVVQRGARVQQQLHAIDGAARRRVHERRLAVLHARNTGRSDQSSVRVHKEATVIVTTDCAPRAEPSESEQCAARHGTAIEAIAQHAASIDAKQMIKRREQRGEMCDEKHSKRLR